jgi:DCN1-like protein 1/2
MWALLLSQPSLHWVTPQMNWLEQWIAFVTGPCTAKGISRDLWNHVLKFARLTLDDESLSWHSEEQSWPAIIDEFAEYMRKKKGDAPSAQPADEMEF